MGAGDFIYGSAWDAGCRVRLGSRAEGCALLCLSCWVPLDFFGFCVAGPRSLSRVMVDGNGMTQR
jgi:hypothetical protein